MQRYDNKAEEQCPGKRILLEFLDFLRFKIENDSLSMEEVESIAHMVEENLVLYPFSIFRKLIPSSWKLH